MTTIMTRGLLSLMKNFVVYLGWVLE